MFASLLLLLLLLLLIFVSMMMDTVVECENSGCRLQNLPVPTVVWVVSENVEGRLCCLTVTIVTLIQWPIVKQISIMSLFGIDTTSSWIPHCPSVARPHNCPILFTSSPTRIPGLMWLCDSPAGR